MKDAIEFVKKFGWDYCKNTTLNWKNKNPYLIISVDENLSIHIEDLKRLVEAHDLVELGLSELKKSMFSDSKDLDYVGNWILTVSEKLLTEKGVKLKQAIILVESCK